MVSFHLLSKQGDRQYNEDAVGMYQGREGFCFALADGLGGHGCGEVASATAVDRVMAYYAEKETQMDPALAFDSAQQAIRQKQSQDRHMGEMKTTLVTLQTGPKLIRWAHIGDSRLYYFRRKKMVSRTLDHSVVQMLAAAGKIKEKQIRNHPDRSSILRALGDHTDEVKVQLEEPIETVGDQAFLLCSDGFWELIEDRKMEKCLKKAKTPAQWLEMMEEIIIKNGRKVDMDNYSAIGVWID